MPPPPVLPPVSELAQGIVNPVSNVTNLSSKAKGMSAKDAEIEFTRIKSIERKFFRVRVSEEDLARFARRIAGSVNSNDNKISIRIESAEQEEVFRTHDPGFFQSDAMPLMVHYVSISLSHYNEPIDCTLRFRTGPSGSVDLSVQGSDPNIPTLVEDIANDLKQKQIIGHSLVKTAGRSWFALVVPPVLAVLTYFVFDWGLDLRLAQVPEFKDSSAYTAIVAIGWSTILLTILAGPPFAEGLVKRYLTPVEFTGRISDPRSKSRKTIFWLVTFVMVPLLVSAIGAFIRGIFNLWRASA